MTVKIYETQSYTKEYETTVTECVKEADSFYIKLKESIFFPEEGGQYSDTGTLCFGEKEVRILKGELLGSSEEGDTDVRYLVDGEIPPGTAVSCLLDWENRFDRMQNHSGEHILSGLIYSTFGYRNTGFHLSDTESVTVDTDGLLTEEQLSFLEREANAVIYANLPIRNSYPSPEELAKLNYRSKIEIRGQVRLITIGDEERTVDVCACCAPHVERTGAVGILKILSAEKFRSGMRLSILCGRRAFALVSERLRMLEKAANAFSTKPEKLLSILEKTKEENSRLQERAAGLTEELILRDIREGRYQNAVCTEMELTAVSMKNLFNALKSLRKGYCGIFCGSDEKGYRYYAGGQDLDARILAAQMKTALDAKGGGSQEMVQGKTFASKEEIEVFFKTICKRHVEHPKY